MRTSLKNVLAAAAAKDLPLPADTAAFVALVLAETAASRPGSITEASVLFSNGGEISLSESDHGVLEPGDGLSHVLGAMLSRSAVVPEALSALADAPLPISDLQNGLEAFLAPLDRTVARKILDRWLKDALRGVPPSQIEVEATKGQRSAMDEILEDLSVPFIVVSDLSAAEAAALRSSAPSRPARRGRSIGLGAIAGLLVVGGAAALWAFRPDLVRRLGTHTRLEPQPRAVVPAPRPVERGTLTVSPEPAGAEVLLLVGHAPVEIPDLPAAPVEVVVRDDDGRVARAKIETDQPQIEIQVPPEPRRADAPLPSTLVPDLPPVAGTPGRTIRVVTDPPGAAVYLRVASVVPDLDVSQPHELLVAKDAHAPATIVVSPADWQRAPDGTRTATASVRLERVHHRRRGR